MSSLQIGLLLLGGVLLLALLAYYLWLSSRSRVRQRLTAKQPVEPSGVREPTLDLAAFDNLSGVGAPPVPVPVPDKTPRLDALLDAIAPIILDAEVSGDALLAALPGTRRVGSKPFALEGFSAASQCWESPHAGRRYSQLQAGLQLVNRAGPVNNIEFSEFVVKIEAVCQAINGTADFPDMRHEVNRARELDRFASQCDAQIAFMLRPRRTAWGAGYVQQMAAALGFIASPMAGRMIFPAANGALLGLNFDAQAALAQDMSQSVLREVSLTLDVPQVPRNEGAFARMCELAQQLAQKMDGVLSDDNGVVLTEQAMNLIGAELDKLYEKLEQCGFGAGSSLARRLFS